MSIGFNFRATPDKLVACVLLRWIGSQRFVKNAKVREDRYYRTFQRKFLEFAGQYAPVDRSYSHLIGDGGGDKDNNTTWLREVPSVVLRNGAVRFYQGYQRFFKGLARRPTITSRHGKQSVWLTSELFKFTPVVDKDGVISGYRLFIGTKKFPCGELPFTVNMGREKNAQGKRLPLSFTPPASIHVSVNAGRWQLSFCNETVESAESAAPSPQQTLDHLRQFTEEELLARTIGCDRGVAVPLMVASATSATSAGGAGLARPFELLDAQKSRLTKKQKSRARWQRIAARRCKGSKNRRKANLRAAHYGLYAADVRKDYAHKTSHALVSMPQMLLFVFEALQVKNMTRSATGTVAEPGKKVAQKRGLNRSILASAWGEVKMFTKYKALAAGKLCIEVPAHYSSQESLRNVSVRAWFVKCSSALGLVGYLSCNARIVESSAS